MIRLRKVIMGLMMGWTSLWGITRDSLAAEIFAFPTVNPEHKHARMLLENAMRYFDASQKIVDPASGYPVEGWNHEPEKAFFLRSFTQLTAIGEWLEMLANVMAGRADTPYLSRSQAETQLRCAINTLREDQHDPHIAFHGLLGNFLTLECGKRLGPLCGDHRRVMAAFGDNANLSTSVAKTIGALLSPSLRDKAELNELRQDLEQFLEDQREGYARLYDPQAGLFRFGWDVAANQWMGWDDCNGKWQPGYMDYMVNEFRGPTTFLVLRYGLPAEGLGNLGFKLKPYRLASGKEVITLAPWEGSAFQALGLDLAMLELKSPAWRTLLENVVDAEIDYSLAHGLPGFLSECYTGDGCQYTGAVGIPDIAVNSADRITHSASLYTLGVAYTIAPDKVERFLAANWPVLSRLRTDHGPWEGFNLSQQKPIHCQTTAHTLSLILGLLGTGSDNMQRYLEHRGLMPRWAELEKPGEKIDLLADKSMKVFAWTHDKTTLTTHRPADQTVSSFHVQGNDVCRIGMAFVTDGEQSMNLSNGRLRLRYRSREASDRMVLAFKTTTGAPRALIPKEFLTRLAATDGQEAEMEVPLPPTPGLAQIKEVVITLDSSPQPRPVDLLITRLEFLPYRQK